eukprot:m.46136 g.46136  ORF g.46136 m.46136 type:complete len:428 (-) comp20158_c0_seq1:90-1373(-)
MRPPLLKLKVVEKQYSELLAAGYYEAAVEALVKRVALTKLCFGNSNNLFGSAHPRGIKAELTLARGYLELLALPAQAFKHTRLAKKHLKIARGDTGTLVGYAEELGGMLELEIDLMLGTCIVAWKEAFPNELKVDMKQGRLCLDHVLDLCKSFKQHRTKLLRDVNEQHITALHQRGLLAMLENEFTKAVSWLNEGIEMLLDGKTAVEINDDDDRSQLIALLRGLTDAHTQLENDAEAEKAIATAKSLVMGTFGEQSEEAATLLVQEAQMYIKNLSDENAEDSLKATIQIYLQLPQFGPQHPKTLVVQNELVRLLIRLENYNAALKMIQATMQVKLELFGENSVEVASDLFLMGNVLLQQEKHTAAIKHLEGSMKIYRITCGPQHKARRQVEKMLEALLTKSKRDTLNMRRSNFKPPGVVKKRTTDRK